MSKHFSYSCRSQGDQNLVEIKNTLVLCSLFREHFITIFPPHWLSHPAEGRCDLTIAGPNIPLWSCHYSACPRLFNFFGDSQLNNLFCMTHIAFRGRRTNACIFHFHWFLMEQTNSTISHVCLSFIYELTNPVALNPLIK